MKFTLKQKMKDGKLIVGCFINYYAPAIVEMIGKTGCDFVVLDNEHGYFSPSELETMVRAADSVGLSTIVRVDYDNSAIQKALDMGAEGIQVPKVNSRQDAELAVKRAKYPPMGDRGVGFSARAVRVAEDVQGSYLDWANENTLVTVQIETAEAVQNLEEIASTPGVDVVFLGKMDLSTAVGTPRVTNSPIMKEMTERFFEVAAKCGTISGYVDDNSMTYSEAVEKGVRYITTVAVLSPLVSETVKKRNELGQ